MQQCQMESDAVNITRKRMDLRAELWYHFHNRRAHDGREKFAGRRGE